jgi:Probable cobalt transporter subunit (CbtB)
MSTAVDEKSVAEPSSVPLQIAIPMQKVVPWGILGGVLMALAYYFVGAEQGATSVVSGMGIHEFVHDARHLLGFPCH